MVMLHKDPTKGGSAARVSLYKQHEFQVYTFNQTSHFCVIVMNMTIFDDDRDHDDDYDNDHDDD